MTTPNYYGSDPTQTPDRKKQAVQSALISDQNMVEPERGGYGPMMKIPTEEPPVEQPGSGKSTRIEAGPTEHQPGPGATPPVTPSGTPSPPGQTLPAAPTPQNPTDWLSVINKYKTLYTPTPLTPEFQQNSQLQMALLQKVLNAPDAFTEENVRQMQEAQKEYTLATQQSEQQKLLDRYAGQGRYGSGRQNADLRRMADTSTGQILQSNRDIGLQAADKNFNSRISALSTGNDVLGSALKTALSQEGLQQDQVKLALQAALGTSGMTLDQWKAMLAAFTQLGIFNTSQTNQNSSNLAG